MSYGSMRGLECYVDASFAAEVKRSVTGWIVQMRGGPVLWDSRRQGLVSMGSNKSEAIVLSETTCEALWPHVGVEGMPPS
jgi:hypothetical protein